MLKKVKEILLRIWCGNCPDCKWDKTTSQRCLECCGGKEYYEKKED